MSKKILLLTYYYPPDLSAGSFRAQSLVEALQRQGGESIHIDVLSTQPNRYSDHAVLADNVESHLGLNIRRVYLPARRDGFLGQALSFGVFARKVYFLTSHKDYQLVIATSSRLMTALLGALVARRCGADLYLDIRDIFVDNLDVLFGRITAMPVRFVFRRLERFAFMQAKRINLVSKGFLKYFSKNYPTKALSFFSNGIDSAFIDRQCREKLENIEKRSPVRVVYAGNVGDGQAMHLIVPDLARQLGDRVHFSIIGAGGRIDELKEAVERSQLHNVEIHSPMARAELLDVYSDADVLFLHLNDKPAFRHVLPSKLFEYAAIGKPIWAGVSGYAADFIAKEIENAAIFYPCDVTSAVSSFSRLELRHTDRSNFVLKYERRRIMDAMALDILDVFKV